MIKLKNIRKSYQTDRGIVDAVIDASLDVQAKEVYGIAGFSGAGKSTLLRTVNLLEKPTNGTVIVDDQILTDLTPAQLRKVRHRIGIIFQHFNLLANRTVWGNVSFALEIANVPKKDRSLLVEEALTVVDLLDKAEHYPAQLSGGQKQRVAIARAISTHPKVLLCDEPTSALDPKTTETILSYLKKINEELSVTILIVTHEMDVIRRLCHRVAIMEGGRIIEKLDLHQEHPRMPYSEIGKILMKTDSYGVSVSV